MYFPTIERFLFMLPAFVLAISCHEYAHAWVADKFGDPTARMHGRLTLNPRSHFDLFGFLLFIFAGFGWAKGVPFDSRYFKGNKRIAMISVALAGVTANLLLAIISLIVLNLFLRSGGISPVVDSFLIPTLSYIFQYNVIFMIFNLLPIPPLDGSKVIAALIPGDFEERLSSLDRFGFLFLIILIVSGWTNSVLFPLMNRTIFALRNLVELLF